MSINSDKEEKSLNEFSLDIIEKTKLFFKSFNELTKENLETYLECIELLDIWNTKEEKEFLWNSFYKYNINGKVIEYSVIKGLNELFSKDNKFNSLINYEEKDSLNIIRLSYDKKKSSSIIKSSSICSSENISDNKIGIIKKDNLNEFINNRRIKELKQIKNIMTLLNYEPNNSMDKNNSIKISEIKELFYKYPFLKMQKDHIINYLSNISNFTLSKNNNYDQDDDTHEFIINNDLLELSNKLIDNKIKQFEKESICNEELFDNSNNEILLSNMNESIDNDIENKIKTIMDTILEIDEEFKGYIQILKDTEKILRNNNTSIIENFKKILLLKEEKYKNKSVNKIEDKDDEKEVEINIENELFFINYKSNELDLFLEKSEKICEKKEIITQFLIKLVSNLIQKYLNLIKENKDLILNKKEEEKIKDEQLIISDEKISKLNNEKISLENKIKDLLEQIEKDTKLYKNNQTTLKEVDDNYNLTLKELEKNNKEINILKKENKKLKDDYDSLIKEIEKININNEIKLKEYEKSLKLNAKTNIEKKRKLNEVEKKLCYINYEELLEYSIDLNEKFNLKEKEIEQINQLLKEKDKKINQLEIDLELYREKVSLLSKEIHSLKEKKLEIKKSELFLDKLLISKMSFNINNSKKNEIVKDRESNLKYNNIKTPLSHLNNDDLFAPPCLDNNDNKMFSNFEETKKGDEFKIIDNVNNSTNNINSNTNTNSENKNKDKLFSNNNIINKDMESSENSLNRLYSNTPAPIVDIKNNSKKKEESLTDIFKNIINDRPSNPFNDNSSQNKKSQFSIINEVERSSNLINKPRESNPFRENDNDNYKINNSFENLNINNELINNNNSINNNIKYINNDLNNNEIYENKSNNIYNNSILNKKDQIYIDKSFSVQEMNEIFKKEYEDKLEIKNFDYLHLYKNGKIREMLLNIGDYCINNEIFSDIVYILDEYDQIYKYILFVTKKSIYIIETITYNIKYTFVKNILLRFTICNNNCNIIVFHFDKGNDLVILTLRRPELIYYFIKIKEEDNKQPELKFKYADEFNVKKDGRYYTQKINSSMNSISFNFQTAIKFGYLTKINEGYIFNQFHEKLVVLTDFGILYFDNPTVSPKRLIPIIGSDIIPLESKFKERKFAFEIRTLNKNKIVFGTDDKDEYKDWIKVFNDIKSKYENKENTKF